MNDFQRIKWIDTLKGIGIILVLIGHFIEPYLADNCIVNTMFTIVYSFHMPLFCMLSGVVAKKNVKRVLLYYCWIYIISQLIYLGAVRIHLLGYDISSNRLYDTYILPFWHLWYLYALILWSISLYIIDILQKHIPRCLILVFTYTISILCGFIDVEKPYGLMRVFTFYPFFLFGYFYKGFLNSEKWGVE